jgi:hypothetical protein
LEQHPDVLLRRRARRALHHQRRILRRAARAADAPRFAAAAVSAMRVACAPHYPAEPRALVGGDVILLLQGTKPSAEIPALPPPFSTQNAFPQRPEGFPRAAEIVRRFFTVTDAMRFATPVGDPAQLLALQPELEQVLKELEARL